MGGVGVRVRARVRVRVTLVLVVSCHTIGWERSRELWGLNSH